VSYIAEHIDLICGFDVLTVLVSESVNNFKSPSIGVKTPAQLSGSITADETAAEPASEVGLTASPVLLEPQAAIATTAIAMKTTNLATRVISASFQIDSQQNLSPSPT
jgi:hypothetical protein